MTSQAEDAAPNSESGTWERHGQTIIAALILAAIIWVGKSVTDMSGTMGVVLNRLDTLERSIATMDERFDRYQTKAEAAANRENQRLRNQIMEGRLDSVEERLRVRQ